MGPYHQTVSFVTKKKLCTKEPKFKINTRIKLTAKPTLHLVHSSPPPPPPTPSASVENS